MRRSTIKAAIPSATVSDAPVVVNPYLLERTLVRRPSHYMSEQLSLVMAPCRCTPAPVACTV